jgi:hypothetical protein
VRRLKLLQVGGRECQIGPTTKLAFGANTQECESDTPLNPERLPKSAAANAFHHCHKKKTIFYWGRYGTSHLDDDERLKPRENHLHVNAVKGKEFGAGAANLGRLSSKI